jgi:hypothetical protein
MHSLEPSNIGCIFWGFGATGVYEADLFDALVSKSRGQLNRFKNKDLNLSLLG